MVEDLVGILRRHPLERPPAHRTSSACAPVSPTPRSRRSSAGCSRTGSRRLQARGQVPNYEASIAKLFNTDMKLRMARAGLEIMGLYGQLDHKSKYTPLKGRFERQYLWQTGLAVGGGTTEIQKNIIAMRGLGLPAAVGMVACPFEGLAPRQQSVIARADDQPHEHVHSTDRGWQRATDGPNRAYPNAWVDTGSLYSWMLDRLLARPGVRSHAKLAASRSDGDTVESAGRSPFGVSSNDRTEPSHRCFRRTAKSNRCLALMRSKDCAWPPIRVNERIVPVASIKRSCANRPRTKSCQMSIHVVGRKRWRAVGRRPDPDPHHRGRLAHGAPPGLNRSERPAWPSVAAPARPPRSR